MAGVGPAPKAQRQRERDTDTRELVKADGKLGGFPLPEGVLPGGPNEEWHPQTKVMWEEWRSSPQSQRMATGVDWQFMLDTALMHHMMWSKGRWDFAGEVRIRMAKFGATPEDRLRIKLEVEVPESFAAGNGGANDTSATTQQKRRQRWGTTQTPSAAMAPEF